MAGQLISGCLQQLTDMAGPMISFVLGGVGSAAYELAAEELKSVKDVGKEVEKLRSQFTAIQAVIEDSERRQIREASVRNWVEKLKEVSLDIDDLLDEWITAINESNSREEEEREGGGGDHAYPAAKKVCLGLSLPSSSLLNFSPRDLALRRTIALEIKELNERLDVIAEERNKYNFVSARITEESSTRPETTSFVDVSNICGREKENELLIRKLVRESSQGIDVIPIVGMGGIGKTTLAQLAYRNNEVKAHFEKRIWVCVSDPFDEIRIAKAIIEAVEENAVNLVNLNTLLQRLEKSIQGKKFLLVLDDVWTKDATKWEPLKVALNNGAIGSKILVTTRNRNVVIMMRAEPQMIHMETLSKEICWSIFSRLAFSGRVWCPTLEKIGKEIANKCKGLPLVAKTLGSLMQFKQEVQQWIDVLKSEIWELENDDPENKIFAPFWLSYNDLPPTEQRCLSYCSIFPKDHIFKKDILIELWMSQGYLSRSKNLEKEGRDCFENLAMRSFFQDFEKDCDGNIKKCKMHDIIHDFVWFLTKGECCATNDFGVVQKMEQTEKKVRHAFVFQECPISISKNKSLRTLFVSHAFVVQECPISISKHKSLRTLFVMDARAKNCLDSKLAYLRAFTSRDFRSSHEFKLPGKINKLKHLRYLNLSASGIKELPNSLCELFNLQTLRLMCCRYIRQLPKGIGKLINLRHLYIEGCSSLTHLPKGITKLGSLRILDWFVIPDCNENLVHNEALKLEDLNSLKHLFHGHQFHISGCGNLPNAVEAERAQLKEKEYLLDLLLEFSLLSVVRDDRHCEILEALQPHPNLKALQIWCYRGRTISPNWMTTLVNLKRLTLHDFCFCESLPPLGKLPSLESLVISSATGVRKVGVEFLGIESIDNGTVTTLQISFPKLKSLGFENLYNWKEWEGINIGSSSNEEARSNFRIMPCLQSLTISECFLLGALPDFLQKTPLQELNIHRCRILGEIYKKEVKQDWHKIFDIPNIKITTWRVSTIVDDERLKIRNRRFSP